MMHDYIYIGTDGSYSILQMEALPPYAILTRVLRCENWIEHQDVLWQGKTARMFTHELGRELRLAPNLKASAIAHNATRQGRGLPTYDDLSQLAASYLAHDLAIIRGGVILWTGPVGAGANGV